jgi:hypothetical protein
MCINYYFDRAQLLITLALFLVDAVMWHGKCSLLMYGTLVYASSGNRRLNTL